MQRLVIAIVFSIAATAAAADYADLYIVPVAGHTRGAFGTAWRSDLVLHNIQQAPITVELALVERGRAPVAVGAPLHLNPGETRVITDVLAAVGRDVTGALIVGADRPFAVTSRIWAETAGGRTLGQTVLPVAIDDGADAMSGKSVVAGLPVGGGQRANVGVFVAASTTPLVAEVATVDGSGATIGSRLVVLQEAGFTQEQFPATSGGAAVVVRILQGDGIVVPYASVVDNVSSEAMFVSGAVVGVRAERAWAMLTDRARD